MGRQTSLDAGFRRGGCSRRAWGCQDGTEFPFEEPKLRGGTACTHQTGLRALQPGERGQPVRDAVLQLGERLELALARRYAKEPPPEHPNAWVPCG